MRLIDRIARLESQRAEEFEPVSDLWRERIARRLAQTIETGEIVEHVRTIPVIARLVARSPELREIVAQLKTLKDRHDA